MRVAEVDRKSPLSYPVRGGFTAFAVVQNGLLAFVRFQFFDGLLNGFFGDGF